MAELKERINGAWVSLGQISPQNISRRQVPATLEDVTLTPSESQQTRTAGQGYDAIRQVVVNAVSSTYVGSGITRRSSTDLTVSGATVNVPAGYYSSAASKSIPVYDGSVS